MLNTIIILESDLVLLRSLSRGVSRLRTKSRSGGNKWFIFLLFQWPPKVRVLIAEVALEFENGGIQ